MSKSRNKKNRRVAILDMGSNSIKLLVAEMRPRGAPRILLQRSSGTRLGEGIHRQFHLSKAAVKRTLSEAQALKAEARKLHVKEWIAVATSAVRDASNRHDFEKKFRKRMGFGLRVLSGDEEAELIYRGATSDSQLAGTHARILVMDSGGGSAEWIRGTRTSIERRVSLPLGCVRMTERFIRGDPCTEESLRRMTAWYEKRLRPLRRPFTAKGRVMIGTGGSISTAAVLDLDLPMFHERRVHGHSMSLSTIEALLEKLKSMTNAERLAWNGLPHKRADIIVAGVALFVSAMRALSAKKVTVSLRGLRYGMLLDRMNSLRPNM